MESRKELPVDFVPCFLRGLEVLLVDHDTVSQNYLSSLLGEYSFKVTATDLASVAQSMICNQQHRFKIVITKVGMPDTDILSFQQFLLEKDIPVIFITSGGYNDLMKKALAQGSCHFLQEPIQLKDLKYVWQHSYFTKHNLHSNAKGRDKKFQSQTKPVQMGFNNHQPQGIQQLNFSTKPPSPLDIQSDLCEWTSAGFRTSKISSLKSTASMNDNHNRCQSPTKFTKTQWQEFLKWQENSSHETPRNELTTRSINYGSKDLTTVEGIPTKVVSVDPYQSMIAFDGNLNLYAAVEKNPMGAAKMDKNQSHVVYDHISTPDVTVGNHVLATAINQNPPQMCRNPITTLAAICNNHVSDSANIQNQSQNQPQMSYNPILALDALCGNHVPTTALYQDQSQKVHDPISNLDVIFSNYVQATAFDQNQFQKAFDPISNLDSMCSNHVSTAVIDQNQSQAYNPILTLDTMCGNHVPTITIDQNQSQKVYVPISTLDDIYNNHLPVALIDQNQSQKVYDPIATLDAICGNYVPTNTMDQNQLQSMFDDLATLGNHWPAATKDQKRECVPRSCP